MSSSRTRRVLGRLLVAALEISGLTVVVVAAWLMGAMWWPPVALGLALATWFVVVPVVERRRRTIDDPAIDP